MVSQLTLTLIYFFSQGCVQIATVSRLAKDRGPGGIKEVQEEKQLKLEEKKSYSKKVTPKI